MAKREKYYRKLEKDYIRKSKPKKWEDGAHLQSAKSLKKTGGSTVSVRTEHNREDIEKMGKKQGSESTQDYTI